MNWTLALGITGTVLALTSLGWNVYNVVFERRERRRPNVHAVVVADPNEPPANSKLAFVNSGHGMARHIQYLLVENGWTFLGGPDKPFLPFEGYAEVTLPVASKRARSNVVWAYMDIDGNVHTKSNDGKFKLYKHPARVEIGAVFEGFYPGEVLMLPPERRRFHLGE